MNTNALYTVTAVDTRNAATYIKFVQAVSQADAVEFVRNQDLRVDAVERTTGLWAQAWYREVYGRKVEVSSRVSEFGGQF
jgi:hypothetical protein